MRVFAIIGQLLTAASALIILSVSLSLVALAFPRYAPFKSFWVVILEWLYTPLKWLFHAVGNGQLLDGAMVRLRNLSNRARFTHSNRRVFLAPHCLRSIDCPAKSSRDGLLCTNCGKCVLGELLEKARRLEYKMYILAGSSFIPEIIQRDKPEGVLLLACSYENNKVMMHLRGLATYAVNLDHDGCILTQVSDTKVLTAMKMGLGD